jgi:hypothetical protein
VTYGNDELGKAGVTDETEQMSDEEAAEAAEIRAEIEEARVEMGGTLNELGDRLEPGHLINEAKENVRDATIGRVGETARGITDMVMDTIKRNPIPAAMAGAGLALLWANRSNGNGHDRRQSYGYGYYDARGEQSGSGIGEKVSEAAGAVGDTVSGAANRVGSTVGQAGENIGQGAGELGQTIGWRLDRVMQANPLAMAAVAVGAGAVVGTLIPETPKEREVLGDASRQVGIAVKDAVDEASTKAEEAIDRTEAEITSQS